MPNILINRAHALAGYLNDNTLFEETIDGFDILDSLASLGLKLVEDPDGLCTAAYHLAILRNLEAEADARAEVQNGTRWFRRKPKKVVT